MKRILTIILAVSFTLGAAAQTNNRSNYFGLTVDGGLGTLLYSPANGDYIPGLSLGAGVEYSCFFTPSVGFMIGLHYAMTQATALYNFKEVTSDLVHADNPYVHYDLNTAFDGWKERQALGFLGVPVEFLWRKSIGQGGSLMAGLGVQMDLNTYGKYTAHEGSYTTTGYFKVLGYEVGELPTHGFDTKEADFESKIDKLPINISCVADMGLHYTMKDSWGLYVGLYASYGLTNTAKRSAEPLLRLDVTNAMQPVYNGTLASNEVNAAHLFRAGLKIGIDLGWTDFVELPDNDGNYDVDTLDQESDGTDQQDEEDGEEEDEGEGDEGDEEEEVSETGNDTQAKTREEQRSREEKAFLAGFKDVAHFETGSSSPKFSKLNNDSWDNLKEAMGKYPNLMVMIVGHSDNEGKPSQNRKLSKERADKVKAMLVSKGIPSSRIHTIGKGDTEPVATNDTEEGRSQNRRIEISIYRAW